MTEEYLAKLVEYFNLRQFFQDNSPLKLLIILGIMIVAAIGARLICGIVQKRTEKKLSLRHKAAVATRPADKTAPDAIDIELFEKVMKNTKRVLYLIILDWGLRQLVISSLYAEVIRVVFTTLCIWAAIEFFTAFIPFNIDIYLRRHGTTLKTSQTRSLMPIITGVVWAIGLTFLLDNLGFHVSTIIAGLGIMGVAVGLAGQAILADFFSYIVILLDKPFRIGDYVKLSNGKAGDVEYMGPKTTHLRSLEDDLIVCANSEMTKGVLVNEGSIKERGVLINIGISYDTPTRQLKNVPDLLRDVVNSFPQCSFDRACLLSFGDSNLIYQLIYLVSPQKGGIRDFMNTQSQVNVAILEKFNSEGISMSYPTEHVLLSKLDAPKVSPAQEQTNQ